MSLAPFHEQILGNIKIEPSQIQLMGPYQISISHSRSYNSLSLEQDVSRFRIYMTCTLEDFYPRSLKAYIGRR